MCPLITGQEDSDGDTVGDVCDNCPSISNPGQTDTDQDGIGDDCEDGGSVCISVCMSPSMYPYVCLFAYLLFRIHVAICSLLLSLHSACYSKV